MKKLGLLFVMLIASIQLFAQSGVSLDTNNLSADDKAVINRIKQTQQIKTQAKEIGAWVGVGREVGEAVNGALGIEEGGSGVPLDRDKYMKSVAFWRDRAIIKV